MMTCNVFSPQLFWFKKLRTNLAFTFVLSIVVNIGMWFERFVIIVPTFMSYILTIDMELTLHLLLMWVFLLV